MRLEAKIRMRLDAFTLDLSFEAQGGGRMLALFGPSGAGKSMTLKSIAGLVRPDEGRIVLGERTLFDSDARIDLPARERRVGYLFQNHALFPTMTVEQNIACGVRTGSRDERQERVEAMIRAMHLDGLGKRRPHQLSGGEQQRVALARCLVNEPEALLLDEPFSAVDEELKLALEDGLMAALEGFAGPCILVSHDRDEVERLCRDIIEIRGGHAR